MNVFEGAADDTNWPALNNIAAATSANVSTIANQHHNSVSRDGRKFFGRLGRDGGTRLQYIMS